MPLYCHAFELHYMLAISFIEHFRSKKMERLERAKVLASSGLLPTKLKEELFFTGILLMAVIVMFAFPILR